MTTQQIIYRYNHRLQKLLLFRLSLEMGHGVEIDHMLKLQPRTISRTNRLLDWIFGHKAIYTKVVLGYPEQDEIRCRRCFTLLS